MFLLFAKIAQVLLEHRDGEMDASLYPLVEKQSFKTAGGFAVRMGKNVVDFDPNFRCVKRARVKSSTCTNTYMYLHTILGKYRV